MASQPPMRGERLGPFLSALPLMHIRPDEHQGLRDARREIDITVRRGRRAGPTVLQPSVG